MSEEWRPLLVLNTHAIVQFFFLGVPFCILATVFNSKAVFMLYISLAGRAEGWACAQGEIRR
jgi:hypothetical protein